MFYKPSNVSSLNHLELDTPNKTRYPNNHYFSLVCRLFYFIIILLNSLEMFQFHDDKTENSIFKSCL